MGHIICATRGGEGSRHVQREALRRAQANGHTLEFLYVADMEAYPGVDDALREPLKEELRWLGDVLLRLAQQRAQAARPLEALTTIREGSVPGAISRYLRERQPDSLLLGAPRGTTASVFGDDEIERFAAEIERDTGIEVIIVRPDAG